MEEKLYFQPENYGKKEYKEPKKKSEKKDHGILKLLGFLLFLAIIVLIIIWLLRGKTTTSGQFPANVRNESLVCESSNITYQKVDSIDSDDKNLKISMVFNGEASFSSASLKYTLHFASSGEAHSAEAVSHAQFNLALQALGYDAGKFNNKFSEIGSDLIITLNLSSGKTLDDTTRSYFLVEYTDSGNLPETLSEYRHNYESQGFACTSTVE